MTAQVHRKNNGKQYAVVEQATRFIFSWWRPGDPLPRLIEHNGERYMLTPRHIDEARVNQRASLLKINVTDKSNIVVIPVGTKVVNRKGAVEQNAVSFKVYTAVTVAAVAAAGIIAAVKAYPL